ncbi:hypothetical protein, partial [Klebsiella quasipneumoniae]
MCAIEAADELAIFPAEGNVCVEERPIPTLQTENDVLVKV